MLSSLDTRRTLPSDPPLWRSRGDRRLLSAASERVSLEETLAPKDAIKLSVAQSLDANDLDPSLPNETRNAPSNDVVLKQLDRVLQSRTFIQSEKLSRFLRFVVEHVIHGHPECLKEYLVGVEVYDRKPPYDPSQDSIVRTEARRLRNKLKEYYGAEGKEDPVFIYLRPGSYIPAFQSREELAGLPEAPGSEIVAPPEACQVVTAIFPFTDITGDPVSAKYARGIPDELGYMLVRSGCLGVVSPFSIVSLPAQGIEVASTMKRLGALLGFEGSVRIEETTLRITARIVDAAGMQLWVERIDFEIGTQTSFEIEEQMAKALLSGFDAVRSPHAASSETTVS